jgi:hypothetical protein
MTHDALHVSVLALGVAALAWIAPLSPARADSSAPDASTPSLSEPAPTPSIATTPNGPTPTQSAVEPPPKPSMAEGGTDAMPRATHAYKHHYARANARRPRDDENPVMAAAHGVVGGVTTLGSVAAYPIYCFPNYGSCRLRRLYP